MVADFIITNMTGHRAVKQFMNMLRLNSETLFLNSSMTWAAMALAYPLVCGIRRTF
jgi:hypothetical protein